MDASDLPSLTVTGLDGDHCVAAFDPSPPLGATWIGESFIACLVLTDDRFVWGRFVEVDRASARCVFRPDDRADLERVRIGHAYPYLDGYWGERAELVLSDRPWQRTWFEPRDAARYRTPQGVMMTEADGTHPPGGELVPGGWDHEHCAICSETLGPGGQEAGFLSPPKTWICERCQREFVEPRSLGFLRDA